MNATPLILAIDLGKFNSVFCRFDPATKATTFRTVPTNPEAIREALRRQPGVTAVMEAGSPAGWVSDLCQTLDVPFLVASTTGAAWQWKNVKRKTDRDDALKLARLAAVGELQAVAVPPKAVRQRKSLIGLRKRFVGERVRGQNRIRGLLVCQGMAIPRGAKTWTEAGLAVLASHAKPVAGCGPEELWRGELDLLLRRYRAAVEQIAELEKRLDALGDADPATAIVASVPGVGPRTAEVVATHLNESRPAVCCSAGVGVSGAANHQHQRDRPGGNMPLAARVLEVDVVGGRQRQLDWQVAGEEQDGLGAAADRQHTAARRDDGRPHTDPNDDRRQPATGRREGRLAGARGSELGDPASHRRELGRRRCDVGLRQRAGMVMGLHAAEALRRPNDIAQQRRGPSELHVWQSLPAPAVGCIASCDTIRVR